MLYITIHSTTRTDETERLISDLLDRLIGRFGRNRVHCRSDEKCQWYVHTPQSELEHILIDAVKAGLLRGNDIAVTVSEECNSYVKAPCWHCNGRGVFVPTRYFAAKSGPYIPRQRSTTRAPATQTT